MLQAVLFDAVGTLIELREPVGETYRRAAAEQGRELPAWRIEDAFQRVVARAEAMVFPELAADARPAAEREWWRRIVRSTFLAVDSTLRFPDAERLFDGLFAHYAGPEAWQLRAGARETLVAVAASRLRVGIASNLDHRLPLVLEQLEIASFFDSITLPHQCGFRKPEAGFYHWACQSLGAPPGATAMVDDQLAGAAEAGLQAEPAPKAGAPLASLGTRLIARAS